MPSQKSLPGVTAAGVIAIALAAFGLLGCFFAGLGLLLMPQLQQQQGLSATPPEARAMTAMMMFLLFALSVFGIFVGIGVLRRRNWARITTMIWGGFMSFVGLIAVAFTLFLFSAASSIAVHSASRADAGPAMAFVKIFVVFFYGVPAIIGIWWLVLFTRPHVALAFTTPAPLLPAIQASGFPQAPAPIMATQAKRPTCPLPIAFVAGLLLFGAAFLVLSVFIPLPSNVPFFLFGHALDQASGKAVFAVFGLISAVAGVGMIKLKPWALHTAIGFQLFGLLNCTVTMLSPNYAPAMRSAMEKMNPQNPVFASGSPLLSDAYFRSSLILGMVLAVVVLVVLLSQRSRFLQQAGAANPPSPSRL